MTQQQQQHETKALLMGQGSSQFNLALVSTLRHAWVLPQHHREHGLCKLAVHASSWETLSACLCTHHIGLRLPIAAFHLSSLHHAPASSNLTGVPRGCNMWQLSVARPAARHVDWPDFNFYSSTHSLSSQPGAVISA